MTASNAATSTSYPAPHPPTSTVAAHPRDAREEDEERGDEDRTAGRGNHQCCSSLGILGPSLLVKNEGSTARDYLARERNWLSWVKLSVTLSVISAALLLRFQFGEQMQVPGYELASEIPLGALFFIASAASLAVGAGGPMTYDRLMRRRTGFIYSGKTTQFVVWGICGLTISACVLLLVAGE